jgi:hypothetical protein
MGYCLHANYHLQKWVRWCRLAADRSMNRALSVYRMIYEDRMEDDVNTRFCYIGMHLWKGDLEIAVIAVFVSSLSFDSHLISISLKKSQSIMLKRIIVKIFIWFYRTICWFADWDTTLWPLLMLNKFNRKRSHFSFPLFWPRFDSRPSLLRLTCMLLPDFLPPNWWISDQYHLIDFLSNRVARFVQYKEIYFLSVLK